MSLWWLHGFRSSRRGNTACLEIPAACLVICMDAQLHMDIQHATMGAKLRLGKQTSNTSLLLSLYFTPQLCKVFKMFKLLLKLFLFC